MSKSTEKNNKILGREWSDLIRMDEDDLRHLLNKSKITQDTFRKVLKHKFQTTFE